MTPIHRMFFHYSEFPFSVRALFTGTLLVLGIGYLFAMLHVYNSHAGRDGQPGLSVEDLSIAYSGNQEDSGLEAALKGPMSEMLPLDEKAEAHRIYDRSVAWMEERLPDSPPLIKMRQEAAGLLGIRP